MYVTIEYDVNFDWNTGTWGAEATVYQGSARVREEGVKVSVEGRTTHGEAARALEMALNLFRINDAFGYAVEESATSRDAALQES